MAVMSRNPKGLGNHFHKSHESVEEDHGGGRDFERRMTCCRKGPWLASASGNASGTVDGQNPALPIIRNIP